MYDYSLTQWVLFFFWYCFLGWIWECFYVSVKHAFKTKKLEFINRGFLHGPMIPIYGFAAITILLATIRLRDNTIAVYIVGALTATMFELVTGTAMERIFKVKYWDYSDLPVNYNGHICLIVSMFWGFFSVLLVQLIHVPVENILMTAPDLPLEIAAFSLTILFGYDTSVSVNEAMDLRELLEEITESSETLQKLERRLDAVVAFTPIPDLSDLPSKEELREQFEEQLKKSFGRHNKKFLRAAKQLKRNPTLNSKKHREHLETLKELLRNRD